MTKETEPDLIAPGSRVRLHFSLATSDGTELTSTFGQDPIDITLGKGSLIEGLEQSLIGLHPGDQGTFALSAEDAYGPRDEERLQQLPRTDFPAEMTLEPGLVIGFETPTGEELAGIVAEIAEQDVLIDFNHPLAGRDILFRVQILEILDPEA